MKRQTPHTASQDAASQGTLSQDTRSHILTVGRRLTATRGYRGVGLSELLQAAGVPKGSFYHYFASKEVYGCALLTAFVEEYEKSLSHSLNDDKLTARDRLLTYFETWHARQISGNPEDRCLVVKLSAEVADLSPDMSRILQRGVAAILRRLSQTLRDGAEDGSIAPIDDAESLAEAIYHQWLGASLLAGLSHDDAPLRSAMDMTRKMIPPA